MKVKFDVTKSIENAFRLVAIGIVGFVVVDNHKYTKIDLEKCKQQIYRVDSNRYNKFNNSYKERNRYADYQAWGAEREKMLDSMKKIGAAEKSYFEGLNTIR